MPDKVTKYLQEAADALAKVQAVYCPNNSDTKEVLNPSSMLRKGEFLYELHTAHMQEGGYPKITRREIRKFIEVEPGKIFVVTKNSIGLKVQSLSALENKWRKTTKVRRRLSLSEEGLRMIYLNQNKET